MRLMRIVTTVAALVLLAAGALQVSAEVPASTAFERTWARTDSPVATDDVDRTWLWGPAAFTNGIDEAYADAPGGSRMVQYYDKSRMEDNAYRGSDPWDVTNGLLVTELITGEMQTGDDQYESRNPAEILVAGDPSSTHVPTYSALASLMDDAPHDLGSIIATTVAHDGAVGNATQLSAYGVTAAHLVSQTGHTVASPFWDFMNSTGPVYEGGQIDDDLLFLDPYYATGFPLTEAHWARAVVNGTETDVLIQAFQRRVLTYTPSNPDGWQVESGNVGRHYYEWRHEQDGDLEGGVLATFEVEGETFKAWVTNPTTIEQLEDLEAGQSTANIPAGDIEYGPGQANHNAPWSWHIDPEKIVMAEATIELCDGTPSYVEEHLTEFVETIGSYCPWGAELVDLVDYRTDEPSETPTEEPTETPTEEPIVPACDPSYPDFCIAPPPPDLDCDSTALDGASNFTVLEPDPHGFDTDGDGLGCEADEAVSGGDVPVVVGRGPDPGWDGPVKLIDTNVAGALVCIYDPAGVGQDGKPTEFTEDDCELLLGAGKGGDDAGQGEPETFFAFLGDESTAGIEFTEDTNEMSVVVQVEGLLAGDEYSAAIAGFGGCDLNNDGDCDDPGEGVGGMNAVCAPGPGATLPNPYSGMELIDLGTASADDDGDLNLSFGATLTALEVQTLGDLEDNVVVVMDDTGEIVACGIIEAGSVGVETPEDAAARLGAIVVGETDIDGDIAFGLPAGDYVAVITADGYEFTTEAFTLEDGEMEVNEVDLVEE
jgi:hypothetical protein